MPPPVLAWVPSGSRRDIPAEIISNYRALLRATSYLPDSFARKYAYERIKSRFRTSRAKAKATASKHSPFRKETEDFTIQRLQRARRSRRLLENASDGDMDALKKVFMQVHGREGERKRTLLNALLKPDEEALPKDASAIQDLIENPRAPEKEKVPDHKLRNFIRSQQENQPVEMHKTKIRHLKPKIEEENIWGRRMPEKRKASMTNKWWADTLEKILPPVPRLEWERLRDLATGAVPLEPQPVRRKVIATDEEEFSADQKTQALLEYFQTPARPKISVSYEYAKGLKVKLDDDFEVSQATKARNRTRKAQRRQLKEEEETRRLAELEKLHTPVELPAVEKMEIRKRSLRRLYASIWSLSPMMTFDDVRKQWDIKWGGQKSRALEGVVAKPTKDEEELFEGLDNLSQGLDHAARVNWGMNSDVKRSRRQEATDLHAKKEGMAAVRPS